MIEYQEREKLGRKRLFGYSLGAVPAGLMILIFNLKYIELFYDELKLDPFLFIVGQVIYLLINAFNDPLLGNLSDRTDPKRWGSRRTIYIKYGGPIWAFAFLLVWFPWSLDNQFIIFLHYVISICLFDTLFTLVVLVWMALLPEMTYDLDERNKANFWTGILGLFTVLPFLIILGEMNPTTAGFQSIMIFVAIISTICLFIVAYLCKERTELQSDESYPLWRSVKETMKSKSFLIFIAFNFTGAFSGSIGLSYLFVYLLVLGEAGLLVYFGLGIILGYISNFICMKLHESKNWDMYKIIIRFASIKILGTVILLPFVLFTNNLLLIYFLLLFGSLFGGYGLFNVPMMYLSMDEDEVKYGVRREGMFLGMNALFTKPASSIGPIVATIVLTSFSYVAGADVQSESALFGIKILFFLVPTISSLIGLVIIYFYPLRGEKLETLREQLKAIHDKKLSEIQLQ
ncbi:MAG: MFS transporter [Candidatus Hodarchaeales archaeon]